MSAAGWAPRSAVCSRIRSGQRPRPRRVVERVVVGGVLGCLSGGGFCGVEVVGVSVAGTSESSEFCGGGQYRKVPLDHWTAAEREMQSGVDGSLLPKTIGQV